MFVNYFDWNSFVGIETDDSEDESDDDDFRCLFDWSSVDVRRLRLCQACQATKASHRA